MSKVLPPPLLGKHETFALINPGTELYHRKLDSRNLLKNRTRDYVAISYVWSEWKENPSDRFPKWELVRERLLWIVGDKSTKAMRQETGDASTCWLDSKCINQDSAKSKSYWIPRMDQIYAGARCTVLLMRDPSLLGLVAVAQGLKCSVKAKTSMVQWPHSCLLSQSCTTLPVLSVGQEIMCIEALKRLFEGGWRKRAWIFQEILLSQKYLVCFHNGEYIELGDIVVIANLLLQTHPTETWLGDFADWGRRLFYLRHFNAESEFHHLSEANLLQMSTGLEATVPADKIYALCGIMGLKNVPYNMEHSSDEAFQVVVEELVKNGRLAWLYAISPPLNDEGIHLSEAEITPFLLTRLADKLVGNRNKMQFSKTSLRVPVLCIGKIVQTKSLTKALLEASNWVKQHNSVDFPKNLEHLFFLPKVIRRLALDLINPLITDPLFGEICLGLGIPREKESRPTRIWRMIMALCTMDLSPSVTPTAEGISNPEHRSAFILANSAAASLQHRLKLVQNSYLMIWYGSPLLTTTTLGLGPVSCEIGDNICSIKDDKELLLAASFDEKSETSKSEGVDAHFKGMIYHLDSVQTLQWRVRVLLVDAVLIPDYFQRPVFGDHPYRDRKRDCRFDEWMNPGAKTGLTLPGLFGAEMVKGEGIYLNLLRRGF